MSAEFEKTVLEEFKSLHSEINDMHSEIKILQSDVKTLKSDVKTLKSDVQTLKSDVKNLQHFAEITNQSLALIEHKVSFEIPALFDGYPMSRDMQEIQHSRLNSLSIKVEDHDNRISILEQKVK